MTDIVTVLKAGTIIDRNKLNRLKADEMNTVLAGAYANGATVHIIDNVSAFFSDQALFTALRQNDDSLPLILEQRGLTVSEEDSFIVEKFVALEARLRTDLLALIPPAPPYPFATVPDDFDIETDILISTRRIRRKDSGSHSLSPKMLQDMWNDAAAYWTGNSTNNRHYSRADYGTTCTINDDNIRAGCQTIQRYEIEQVALKMGWTFPEVKVKTAN